MSEFFIKFIGVDSEDNVKLVKVDYYSYDTKNGYEQALIQITEKFLALYIRFGLTIRIYVSDVTEYNKELEGFDIKQCDERKRLYCLEDQRTIHYTKYKHECWMNEIINYSPYIKPAKNYYKTKFYNIYRYNWYNVKMPAV